MKRLSWVTAFLALPLAAWVWGAWRTTSPSSLPADASDAATDVDRWFAERWQAANIAPAPPADELQVFRRLSLSLCGTVPALEDVRRFEADAAPQRLERWTETLLADPRFGAYFGRRLADAFVGRRDDEFPDYRYEYFVGWFAERVQRGEPFDATVRACLAARGFPTREPAANYLTAEISQGDDFPQRLAARTVRAALGQRIDCAQCHDHPWVDWKQADFQGLAAFFGQLRVTPFGVEDDRRQAFEVEDRHTLEKHVVEPRVPFEPNALPAEGRRRERLAAWVTHPQNRRFGRAVANRVWALMFGQPYHGPVDDLPDPQPAGPTDQTDATAILDVLAADWAAHGYDVRRTIRVLAASRPFRLSSTPTGEQDAQSLASVRSAWAAFPLSPLQPEQVLGSMRQAASLAAVDPEPYLLEKAARYRELQAFLREYGDATGEEFAERPATIPKTLLMMNGRFTRRLSDVNPMSGPGRIALFAPGDDACLETCFLTCLTRRPTREERAFFLEPLREAKLRDRGRLVEDLFWTLFNAPEFAWNH